jgi:N-acetyl-gamma-glutamyl-phosphate reductase
MKKNVSIIGATGYTGLELIRLLAGHPYVSIHSLTSSQYSGKNISDLYPHLCGICDKMLCDTSPEKVAEESDIVFFCLPHLESQKNVPKCIGKTKIIDLSGDFRIQDTNMFQKYYKKTHTTPKLLPEFVYGLPEIYREEIKNAQNIANVGCFAITAELALLPLKHLLKQVEILAITGSSGSGKSASHGTHHPVRNHNIKSYQIGIHRHIPEIIQTLDLKENQITFVPTSGPFTRGIHLTAFVEISNTFPGDISKHYEDYYASSPFVRIKEQVELAEIVGSNMVDISVQIKNNTIIIQCILDNLVKGASGTALQNMNLLLGFPEETALSHFFPLYP